MIPLVLLLLIGGHQSPRAMLDRAVEDFRAGRVEQSLAGFDRVALLSPGDAPYLCVARGESPGAALKQLLPVGPDARRPMREVYQMFQGRMTQAQVMKSAGSDPSAQFFARLYIGLYLEATGDRDAGRAQIEIA